MENWVNDTFCPHENGVSGVDLTEQSAASSTLINCQKMILPDFLWLGSTM